MHNSTPALSSKNPMTVMFAFYPIVVITGFIQILIPSTIHMVMSNFGIGPGEAGIVSFIYFSGILISAIIITHLIKLYSVKALMIMSALLVALSLYLCFLLSTLNSFLVLYFFIGLGNGIMIILPGIYSTHQYGNKNAKIQATTFSFLAIGFIIGPVFPGLISYINLSWKWCFAFPGLLIIPALIPIVLTNFSNINNAEKLTVRVIRDVIKFDKRFFVGITIAVTIAAGSATAFLTWMITFLESSRNTTDGLAHMILALMGIGSVAGRQMWAKITPKGKVYKTLLVIIPAAALIILIAPISNTAIVNICLFFFASVFLSGINPLFLAAAGIYPRSHSSGVYTILFIFMSMGGILIPFAIGQVLQFTDPVIGMSSISFLFVIVLLALIYIRKEIPLSKHIHHHLLP
jgi:MFS family permease